MPNEQSKLLETLMGIGRLMAGQPYQAQQPVPTVAPKAGTASLATPEINSLGLKPFQETLKDYMNQNIKSVTTKPDGSKVTTYHDDTNLASALAGRNATPAPVQNAPGMVAGTPAPVAPTPVTPVEGGNLPVGSTVEGTGGNFFSQNNGANATLLLSALAGGFAPGGSPAASLAQNLQGFAQNQLQAEFLKNLFLIGGQDPFVSSLAGIGGLGTAGLSPQFLLGAKEAQRQKEAQPYDNALKAAQTLKLLRPETPDQDIKRRLVDQPAGKGKFRRVLIDDITGKVIRDFGVYSNEQSDGSGGGSKASDIRLYRDLVLSEFLPIADQYLAQQYPELAADQRMLQFLAGKDGSPNIDNVLQNLPPEVRDIANNRLQELTDSGDPQSAVRIYNQRSQASKLPLGASIIYPKDKQALLSLPANTIAIYGGKTYKITGPGKAIEVK